MLYEQHSYPSFKIILRTISFTFVYKRIDKLLNAAESPIFSTVNVQCKGQCSIFAELLYKKFIFLFYITRQASFFFLKDESIVNTFKWRLFRNIKQCVFGRPLIQKK